MNKWMPLAATSAMARAAGLLWRAAGPSVGRTVSQQQRSVGHVQGNKLRGNVLEAWEKREIAKIVATRNPEHFDDLTEQFAVGDSVAVRILNPYSPKRLQTFAGICLEKRGGKQLASSFTLRNHLDGYAVEQQFAYFSPLLKGVRLVAKPEKRPRRAKLFYLRDRPPRESTVTVNEKDINLPME